MKSHEDYLRVKVLQCAFLLCIALHLSCFAQAGYAEHPSGIGQGPIKSEPVQSEGLETPVPGVPKASPDAIRTQADNAPASPARPEEVAMPDNPDAAPGAVFPDGDASPPSETEVRLQAWNALDAQLTGLGENQAEKERLLRAWLQSHPQDPQALSYLARVLSWQSKWTESLAVYDGLLTEYPNDADYLLGKAQVLLWSKHPDAALPVLDRALALSPGYEDLYRAKLQALQQLHQKAALEALRQEAITRFPGKDWKLAQEKEGFPLELEAGYGAESLTNGVTHWANQYVSIRKPFDAANGLYAQVNRTLRFDLPDYQMAGGAYFRVPKTKWGTLAEGSYSPSQAVLPKWSLRGEIQRPLRYGFVASAGYQHVEYRTAITETGTYTLENYWHRFRLAYTLYQSYLHYSGRLAFSHVGQISYFYGARNSVTLTGSLGQELENIGPRGVLSTNVQALNLSGVQMIRPTWGLTYLLLVQRQGDLYTRRGVQLGLRYLL
jgi:YaiO family outer membrane protein